MQVTLTEAEMLCGTVVGMLRRYDCAVKKRPTTVIAPSPWDVDIEGSLAEVAFAKYSELHWSMGVGTFKLPDVGNIQVRHTRIPSGRLILRDADPEDAYYVLVCGNAPNYEVVGYIHGSAAKRSEYRANPNGAGEAYFVPRAALKPWDEMRESNQCLKQV